MQGALFTQLAACVAMLGVSIAVSEAGAQFQEPAQSDVYCYFDAVTGSISPLEMQVTKVMTKNYLFVVEGGYELAGGRSSFRIKSGQEQEFLIRLAPAFEGIREHGFTLKDYVFLTAASARKDRRKIITVRWPLAGTPSINENKIPCDVKAYGDASVLIVPHEPLPAGEYAFMFSAPEYNSPRQQAFFAFGIDSASKN